MWKLVFSLLVVIGILEQVTSAKMTDTGVNQEKPSGDVGVESQENSGNEQGVKPDGKPDNGGPNNEGDTEGVKPDGKPDNGGPNNEGDTGGVKPDGKPDNGGQNGQNAGPGNGVHNMLLAGGHTVAALLVLVLCVH
nr:unnamed protein product [Spirometra erinaceieuropaei]